MKSFLCTSSKEQKSCRLTQHFFGEFFSSNKYIVEATIHNNFLGASLKNILYTMMYKQIERNPLFSQTSAQENTFYKNTFGSPLSLCVLPKVLLKILICVVFLFFVKTNPQVKFQHSNPKEILPVQYEFLRKAWQHLQPHFPSAQQDPQTD